MKIMHKFLLIIFMLSILILSFSYAILFVVGNFLKEISVDENDIELDEKIHILNVRLKRYSDITLLLSDLPAISGLVQAKKKEAVKYAQDPLFDLTAAQWESAAMQIFSRLIELDENVGEIRIIDKNGNEILKAQKNEAGEAFVALPEELESKGEREYFQQAMLLNNSDVFISSVDLSEEEGEIEHPYKPTLRFATPLFDEEGERYGILVVNILFTPLVSDLFQTRDGFLVNPNGEYTFHHDENKVFGFLLETETTYFTDYPEMEQSIATSEEGIYVDTEELHMWRKFYYPDSSERYWVVVLLFDTKEVFAPLFALERLLLFMGFLLIVIAGIVVIIPLYYVLNSLKHLTEVIEAISVGKFEKTISPQLIKKNDEVGILAQAFDRTMVSMKLALMRQAPELKKQVEVQKGREKESVKRFKRAFYDEEDGGRK